MTALFAKDLHCFYGKNEILKGVDISVEEGECVALTGASGCGKSTLCYILSGVIPRNFSGKVSGEVKLFGDDIQSLSLSELVSRVGIVFQEPDMQLFSSSVEQEIAFGPENLCIPRDEIDKKITEVLELVKLDKRRYSSPARLSGGQKQRIALASVLAMRPRALILDEALSQVDDVSTEIIKEAITALKNSGTAILMVEHDPDNLDIADRVLRLEGGRL